MGTRGTGRGSEASGSERRSPTVNPGASAVDPDITDKRSADSPARGTMRSGEKADPVSSGTSWQHILFGVDVVSGRTHADPVIRDRLFRGSWGMVTNDAARCATNPDLLSRKALLDAGVRLTQLFSPEHGISRYGEDGKAMDDDSDPATGLPVCSLYGKTMRPPAERLDRLTGVVFDIPDVGTRFYTYIWTLSHVMEVCSEAGLPLVVLDRVNPLGGDLAASEGPVLDTASCGSFLGRAPIPVRHSLTAGEFARWLDAHWNLELDLTVVPVEGWHRKWHWPDTGLPFVPTSPAMPSYGSALCYPGTCLFEATNVSSGRGTDAPFQQFGAPWMQQPGQWLEAVEGIDFRDKGLHGSHQVFASRALPGVRFHETVFIPQERPWKDKSCHGIRLEVTDHKTFLPVRTGLALLAAVRQHHAESFRWDTYPTAANPTGEGHFERLIGVPDIRPLIDEEPVKLLRTLPNLLTVNAWQNDVIPFLCYPN